MQAQETTFERHYSVDELASIWGVSDDFVRRLFLNEPGVVVFFKHRPGKRTYRTVRIPESVARRVHLRMEKPVAGTSAVMVLGSSSQRQSHGKRRPRAHLAFDLDRAPVHVDDSPGDRKPESRAIGMTASDIRAEQPIEDPR